jgi:hypothetical protein
LFISVAAFADLAWRRVISKGEKVILAAAVTVQVFTLILNGERGNLVIALLLPFFIRAAQHDRSVRRWLGALVVASFLLAPIMDLMNQTRQGWHRLPYVDHVSWNLVEAHRDDNFFWLTNLVAYRSQGSGLLSYKGLLGFAAGIRQVGIEWVEIPIPRALWPDKPEWWKTMMTPDLQQLATQSLGTCTGQAEYHSLSWGECFSVCG